MKKGERETKQGASGLQRLRTLRRAIDLLDRPKPPSGLQLGFGSVIRRWVQKLADIGQTLGLGGIAKGSVRLWRRLKLYVYRQSLRAFIFVYGFIYRHRHGVRSRTADLSDLFFDIETSHIAARLLAFGQKVSRRNTWIFGKIYFLVLSQAFVGVIAVHMAAGQNTRALTTARHMNILFRTSIRKRRQPVSQAYFEALRRSNMFRRIVREAPDVEDTDNFHLNRTFGIGHLYCLDAAKARAYFERAISIHENYFDYRMLGRAHLLENDLETAAKIFEKSAIQYPPSIMAHQNYAGRYDMNGYRPRPWELMHPGPLMIYDNLGQFAEEQFLHGSLTESLSIYQEMLRYQDKIAEGAQLPARMRYLLKAEFDHFDLDKPTRILPYEWVTQFGHIGLFSSFLKMAMLGMVPDANYVILAPKEKVVNSEYLAYWDRYFFIVREQSLVDELFPYQRQFGENFMVCRSEGRLAEPWTRAAARAQIAWAETGRGAFLSLSESDREHGTEMLRTLGVPPAAWYVGLHAREGGFYREARGGMSEHRNGRIEDYFPAIQEIVSRGGVVVRLGDSSMRPLPPMPGVIDYAHSSAKSARMDLFLLATSKFIIGTTSGLTTVTHSFGTPTLLVNCISNDWQLWDEETDFILKKVYDRQRRRYLSLAETYRHPIQGYLMNNTVLERHGYFATPNSAAEILAAVIYKLDIVLGSGKRADNAHPLIEKYRQALSRNPYMFGAAWPVPEFLRANPELLDMPEFEFEAFPGAQWSDVVSDTRNNVLSLQQTKKAPISGS